MAEVPDGKPPVTNVLVVKTALMYEVVAFFHGMGLDFKEEKHGKGPTHFALEMNGRVFEIYPSKDADRVFFVEEK